MAHEFYKTFYIDLFLESGAPQNILAQISAEQYQGCRPDVSGFGTPEAQPV